MTWECAGWGGGLSIGQEGEKSVLAEEDGDAETLL